MRRDWQMGAVTVLRYTSTALRASAELRRREAAWPRLTRQQQQYIAAQVANDERLANALEGFIRDIETANERRDEPMTHTQLAAAFNRLVPITDEPDVPLPVPEHLQ